MLEKETQENFLVALHLLLKENPGSQFYDQDVAERAELSNDMVRVKQLILPQLEKRGFIKMMGIGSRIPLTLTPDGRDEAERILNTRKSRQDTKEEQ